VSGHTDESKPKRKATPSDASRGIGADDCYTLKIRSGCEGGGKGALVQTDKSATLACNNDQYLFQPIVDKHILDDQGGSQISVRNDGKSPTLRAETHGNLPCVLALDRASFNQGKNAQYDFEISDKGINSPLVARTRYIVRRLTPLECERLQGYPDGWTSIGEWTDSNGKKRQTSDAARYKALGNSIALPPWKWVLKRLCACYERDATMASLFDGIGGFPYLWEQINGKGTCLWASEIEEFPMAVTKVRIGGDT
jgi:DNA (cytosine-5)-methyltransferase 1